MQSESARSTDFDICAEPTAIPRRFPAQRDRVLRILARWEQSLFPVPDVETTSIIGAGR